MIIMEDINRLKLVLVEKKKTGKWLAEQLGKNPSTVSKWCSNIAQPDLATLVKVANLLRVGIQDLISNISNRENLILLDSRINASVSIVV